MIVLDRSGGFVYLHCMVFSYIQVLNTFPDRERGTYFLLSV